MPTLNFRNLPLLRVEYALMFEEVRAPDLDEVILFRNAFGERFSRVADFSGNNLGFRVASGELGVGLDNLERGLGLALRPDRIFIAWQKVRPDLAYVRFEELSAVLLEAASLFPARKVSGAAGVYANLIPSDHGEVSDLIHPGFFPAFQEEGVAKDVRLAWELGEDEFKLNVYRVEAGNMLETAYLCETGDASAALGTAHDQLIGLFSQVITEKAKHVWELESS